MNVVIFTPDLRSSAIGRMACLVTRELLAAGHQVAIVRAETERLLDAPVHDFGTELVAWTDTVRIPQLVHAADVLAYQIGDNYEYHRGCLEWLQHAPGIVCLHDYFLGHLFCGWAEFRQDEAQRVLRTWYGERAGDGFFSHCDSASFIQATHMELPLTEWVASMASAVITHSSWGIARVLRACAGPVQVLALPYDAPPPPPPSGIAKDETAFHVLTVGNVNPNKRIDSVIRAIGASDALRRDTVYNLVGAIAPHMVLDLSKLAGSNRVSLLISDAVEEPILARAFAEADVITCLRFPSLEAASASAIEAMLYGKPLVVSDVNFYKEIPDDCVLKIDPDNEVAGLQQALERLHGDAQFRAELGARGQAWARATFRADRYAEQLVALGAEVARAQPVLKAMTAFAQTLDHWGGDASLLNGEHTLAPLTLFNNSTPS
jgi:glycosyltransferase involved in cell wall biosynthesis